MAKHIISRPEWLKASQVDEILSVSSCCSRDFCNWINYWKHNEHWFFNSPCIIKGLAEEHDLDLQECRWFYYEGYESVYNEKLKSWESYTPNTDFNISVVTPQKKYLRGYDIVTYDKFNSAECSPLSCNGMAEEIMTNRHCLLDSFELSYRLVDEQRFLNCEPGPYRIIAVYEVHSHTNRSRENKAMQSTRHPSANKS